MQEDTVVTLQIKHPDYATQIVPVKVPTAGEKLELDIALIPRAQVQIVSLDSTVEVNGTDGAKVSVTPSMFVDQQGNVITDSIEVTITPVDISTPIGLAAFPGEFAGITQQGQASPTPIISYGTVEYKFTKNGEEIQLVAGEQAEIEIPIYVTEHQDGSSIAVGDEIPLWSLNEETGIWLQEGTGTVVASANSPAGFALQATVSHFSWWNCDDIMNLAQAIVTVLAPEAGTALIKVRTTANIGWRANNVDTVIAVATPTGLLPIPSNGEVCFWAEVNFISGNSATTPESCVTDVAGIININLEIQGGTLNLTTSPQQTITAYLNFPVLQTKIQPTTAESQVNYVLESGTLPTGITLSPINATTAIINGIATQVGTNTFVIKGTDMDGNSATVAMSYTVIDAASLPPITIEQLRAMIQNGEDVTHVNTSQITDMTLLFHQAHDFNQDISNWDVSNVTDMTSMFNAALRFNQDISNWDVSNVTRMRFMFYRAGDFNQDISNWDVSHVTSMISMFDNAYRFNQDISNWDVSNVENMKSMFSNANGFNQDISNWNASNVTNMESMFSSANSFNQDIGNWDVGNVSKMDKMFQSARSFNQDISRWDVNNVTSMGNMFFGADNFNQDIGNWDVSNVINMNNMFNYASSFNQDLSEWDVGNVSGMYLMFNNTSSFTNQDLSGWDVSNVGPLRFIFGGSSLSGAGNIEPNWL